MVEGNTEDNLRKYSHIVSTHWDENLTSQEYMWWALVHPLYEHTDVAL